MSFFCGRSPVSCLLISHFYSLINSLVIEVTLIKVLDFYFFLTLYFEFRIDNGVGRALKILGFIVRNITNFSSGLRIFYFSRVRSILEYGVVVWLLFLARDEFRIKQDHNSFLSYATYFLNIIIIATQIFSYSHKVSFSILNPSTRRSQSFFFTSLLNGSIDASDLLTPCPLPQHEKILQCYCT